MPAISFRRAPRLRIVLHAVLAVVLSVALGATLPAAARAQTTREPTAAERIAAGNRESMARRSASAYAQYVAAIALDGRSYEALWRAAREAVDMGEVEGNEATRRRLYQQATDYAKRAVAVNPGDAEGHFHLSRALGRSALNVAARERVKLAVDVRASALRALELQPRHPGASHVLGVWNAEVMRLNGISRSIARAFMGGQALASASWAEATRYMELSVAVEPNRLVHLLDLARVYRDSGRKADARATYQAALRAPDVDANDAVYRSTAEKEFRALR